MTNIVSQYDSKVVLKVVEADSLCGADLCGANLHSADLHGADLRNADLQEADLCGANLQEANLRNANLRNADLQEANLQGANLRSANLSWVNLRNADLCRAANLQGANLRGADLRGAEISCHTITSMIYVDFCEWERMFIILTINKELRILIGCRDFSLEEARVHWKDREDRKLTMLAVDLAEAWYKEVNV